MLTFSNLFLIRSTIKAWYRRKVCLFNTSEYFKKANIKSLLHSLKYHLGCRCNFKALSLKINRGQIFRKNFDNTSKIFTLNYSRTTGILHHCFYKLNLLIYHFNELNLQKSYLSNYYLKELATENVKQKVQI